MVEFKQHKIISTKQLWDKGYKSYKDLKIVKQILKKSDTIYFTGLNEISIKK